MDSKDWTKWFAKVLAPIGFPTISGPTTYPPNPQVDQIFAREVVMNGQAELLEGGFDGFR